MDEDLSTMDRAALVVEVQRLRAGIREHRDSTGHDLCWYHPALWSLLPEQVEVPVEVPEWPRFLEGCLHYRRSLDDQLPEAPRVDRPFDG